ncbi:MAG: hypothetical protein EA405_07610 [Rhodospirillales bacterium]|nr:MAG: hypothetical protein EA405_07610 [Rhodospirillales bacterium]
MSVSNPRDVAVRWSAGLSVGIPALDADRRCLVRVISLLQGIDDGEEARTMVGATLDTLALYAPFHFAREERVLEAFGYPGLEVHRNEHRGFIADLERLRKRFGGRADRRASARLLAELTDRLTHHVLLYDMDYKGFIGDLGRAEQLARGGSSECLLAAQPTQRPRRNRARSAPVAASLMH